MAQDLEGLGDRFVHLTSLGEVLQRFTASAKVDEEQVRGILSNSESLKTISAEAARLMAVSEEKVWRGEHDLGPQHLPDLGRHRGHRADQPLADLRIQLDHDRLSASRHSTPPDDHPERESCCSRRPSSGARAHFRFSRGAFGHAGRREAASSTF